jgi:uncharacterized caspase-like protein
LQRLYAQLGKLPAKEVVVVLDACFSGAGGRSVLAKGARPLVMQVQQGAALPPHMAVLAATRGSQISTSSEEKGHGIFTFHFLRALSAGKNGLSAIYADLKPRVENEAMALNVQQSPDLLPGPDRVATIFQFPMNFKPRPARTGPDPKALKALAREQERIALEKLRLEEERRRLRTEQESQAREAAQREAEREQRMAAEKRKLDQEKKQFRRIKRESEPVFVPPTF